MYRRIIKVKRVHGVGSREETEIVVGSEQLHANGAFSNVYRAQLLLPVKQQVAIKKVWLSKTSLLPAAHEIDVLRRVNHPHVVNLLYHFRLNIDNDICECLVFDFLPTDLSKLRLKRPGRRFDQLDAKLYAWQMFAGIDYVNSCGITHFDLKPSNLIVDDAYGLLKLADFGNAKILKRYKKLNPYQVTRYYRAPELVFGTSKFSVAIDRWAAGCVMAELILSKPLLSGRDSIDQGRLIIDVLGYPTADQIKAMHIEKPRLLRKTRRGFRPLIANSNFPEQALDILNRILVYEPNLRLCTEAVLAHSYFDQLRSTPPPLRFNGLSIPPLNYWTVEQKTQSDRSNQVQASALSSTAGNRIPTVSAIKPETSRANKP